MVSAVILFTQSFSRAMSCCHDSVSFSFLFPCCIFSSLISFFSIKVNCCVFQLSVSCLYLFHWVIATEFELQPVKRVLHAVDIDSLNVKNMNYDQKE